MQSQKLAPINITKAGENRHNMFHMQHDVHTTSGFGEVQPTICHLLIPNSTARLQNKTIVRLSAMLLPTLGRMKVKQWHQYVRISDLYRNFDAMMAQQPVARGSLNFVPTNVPYISLAALSALCLTGAECTCYIAPSQSSEDPEPSGAQTLTWNYNTGSSKAPSDLVNKYKSCINTVVSYDVADTAMHFRGNALRLKNVLVRGERPETMTVPLATFKGDWTDMIQRLDDDGSPATIDASVRSVPIESADIVIRRAVSSQEVNALYAFRLSAFGKRLRKILIGLGYQLDLASTVNVNILPLFAYYKAYFDLFGLTLYENYESSNASKILTTLEYRQDVNVLHYINESEEQANIFKSFIYDVGQAFATETPDFVSALIDSTAVSPANAISSTFVDVDNNNGNVAHITSLANPETDGAMHVSSHAYINDIIHGQLDSEYLKRLYRWTNRNTIAGRKIADILRAQGLGSYVDNVKQDFIGFDETHVSIDDVDATSDTFNLVNNGEGARLGEYAGKGIGASESKHFEYTNDEFGYWITVMSVIPEAGFCQGVDPSLMATEKFGFFNPDFDSLGYEAFRKLVVCGQHDHCDFVAEGDRNLGETFGYGPRYFGLKMKMSKANGDFSLRGTRDGYLPFFIDKFMALGDKEYIKTQSTLPYLIEYGKVNAGFSLAELPNASPIWRFIAKYPWLANFDRIFARTDDVESLVRHINRYGERYWLQFQDYDNFVLHFINNFTVSAKMLAVEDSFETIDEEKGANGTIKKS